jgi:hypothetical protein
MSDGGGLAIGIGAGMAIGIATGIGAGKKKAKEEILRLFTTRAVSLRDTSGNEIAIEQFLDEAIQTEGKAQGPVLALLIIGLILVLGALAFLFLFR